MFMWSASLFSLGWCDLQATYPSLEPLLAVSASLGTDLLDITSALCFQDKMGRFLQHVDNGKQKLFEFWMEVFCGLHIDPSFFSIN